jgi:hypothetical protein
MVTFVRPGSPGALDDAQLPGVIAAEPFRRPVRCGSTPITPHGSGHARRLNRRRPSRVVEPPPADRALAMLARVLAPAR